MPWPFSESIKKRACRYLLQRYLGHFLQEKLSLEQLSLDLYQGTGSLAQVPLDKWVRAAGGQPGGSRSPPKGDLSECPPSLLTFSPSLGVVRIQVWQGSQKRVQVLSLFLASLRPQITCVRNLTEAMESTLKEAVVLVVWGLWEAGLEGSLGGGDRG